MASAAVRQNATRFVQADFQKRLDAGPEFKAMLEKEGSL
jgi:hypothetical protein